LSATREQITNDERTSSSLVICSLSSKSKQSKITARRTAAGGVIDWAEAAERYAVQRRTVDSLVEVALAAAGHGGDE
jgi:hypothetical protein